MRDLLEDKVERLIFASRWILAPIYLCMVGGLVVILINFLEEFFRMCRHATTLTQSEVTMKVLSLLDLALLANLVLIILFAGYETFVSKIGAAESAEDRPHWMGHVDFSGLKIKLIGSLVAISVIELLQDFEHARGIDHISQGNIWRVVLHVTFVFSGVMFAVMDWLGDRRTIMNQEAAQHLHDSTATEEEEAHIQEEAMQR
jgi:uncharacterized protein (TIGR00645 family)